MKWSLKSFWKRKKRETRQFVSKIDTFYKNLFISMTCFKGLRERQRFCKKNRRSCARDNGP